MLEYFFSFLTTFFQGLQYAHMSRKDKSDAISALKDALRHTKKHIKEKRVENFGDVESTEIAKKWSDAARLIRPFDPDFANAIEHKADYWTDPYGFKQEISDGNRRFNFRFRITEVENQLRDFENLFR